MFLCEPHGPVVGGGGGSNRGGFHIWTCPSRFVLFFFPFSGFPDLSCRDVPGSFGISPMFPFPLPRPVKKNTYKEHSQKGPGHDQGLS